MPAQTTPLSTVSTTDSALLMPLLLQPEVGGLVDPLGVNRPNQSSRSLLFMDGGVADYQMLVAGVSSGTEVHLLDSSQDAVTQITNTLLGRNGISSLHIVSHGEAGGLDFGTGKLNLSALPEYAAQLQSWSKALTDDADILLYGCNVAQGELGKAFTSILSQLTGADVAASDNLTGSAALGGDWNLEFQTGEIESALGFRQEALRQFQQTLAPSVIVNEFRRTANTFTNDEYVEFLLTTDQTASQLETLFFGDSATVTIGKTGIYQFTGLSGIATNFKAGTIIVVGGSNVVPTEDTAYNPVSTGDDDAWNIKLKAGTGGNNVVLRSGTWDFANSDVAWIGNTNTGTESLHSIAYRSSTATTFGAFGNAASVRLDSSPNYLQYQGDGDQTSDASQFATGASGSLGLPTVGTNAIYINSLRTASAPTTPTVNLSTATANITEGSTGNFTVSRTDTSGALAVNLTIDGTSTAVLGSSNDYTLDVGGTPVTLTGNNLSVTIPDTQTSVTLNMAALAEAIGFAEATDTLKLNLSTGTGYSIGSSNTASIAITQNGFIVTTISDMGEGSLRQAILNANAIAGADTITFGGSAFTDATPDIITLASGLTLTDNVTILGTGANQLTVAGAGTSSFDSFTVNSGVTASFDGLTVSNSRYGIFNSGTIANLSNSTFNGNSMGVYNTLGTIVSVSNSTFNGNSNGLYIADGTLTRIDSSTFSNHLSSAFYNQGTTASVSNSTFNGNNYGLFNNGTIALISNNTISGNRVGIFNNNFFGPSVTTTIVNNTIAGSTGQAILNSSTISNLYNNLLVGNADNSIGDTTNQGNNLSGTFADFNVDSILKNNGGSTLTHALLTGSAAANAGDNTQLPQDTLDRDGDSNTTEAIPFDQRGTGFDRVVGGIVDIGAFESNITPNAIPVVTVAATLLAYTENDPITLIDSTATVIDTDSTNFDTGTLTVNFSANGTVDDRLAIRNQGTSTGQVGVSGNSVSYEGTQIGIVTGGTGSTALVITFNTSATAAAVSALLQNLTYENVSEAPSSAARTVQFVVTDGAGGTSTAVTKTINVTAVDDTEFFVTNTNDSGSGSLRQAVLDANADAGAETITFIGSTFTDATPDIITLATGELGISSDVTLTGTGASLLTLSGNNASRVLNISRGVVSIDGVTIANGQTSEIPTNGQFNALNVGGGVSNSGTLTLNNSLFTNNRAVFGGGLHNNGTLTINQSLFTQNHAYGGGGLSSDGTLTVNNSTFFNNITDDGAGIGTGGGIQLGRGTAVLTNVTLSGNQANGGRDDGGGGIMMYGGQLTVINSTIFGNSTTSTTGGGGISNIGAGSIQITLKNTIVAGNTSVASKPDVSGTVVSGGNNLIGANNGSTGFTNGTNGDLVGTIVTPINPLLAALAANGGLTQTHALLPGSTAINSGTSTGAPVTDQRGISRVGAVDIGAFESRGFTVALTGGNNQSTSISTTFTNPLTVNVSSAFNEPVAGGQITYKPNGLGSADASFASSSATVDSSGNASATTTANGTAGSYTVTAGGAGIATAASFSLTNTPPDALPTTLLWRNGTMGATPTGTGENVVWQLNNFTLQSGYFIPTVADLNWQIISTADFDRDGHADILWRNRATGENVIWQMNSTGLQSGYFLTPVADANWRIIDTADFNGDGTPDLVWRHQVTGENAIWQMNGFSTQTSALLTAVADVNWQIVSTADFDNDGKADLLWRNRATGENAIWQMNGLTLKSGFFFTRVADTNWQVAGTADLNGDGIADLVWRNQVTGENALWQMNSTGLQTGSLITAVPDLNWQIAGVADLGGDSTPDLLWRNTATGLVGIWQLSSFSLVRAYPLPDVASEWNVRPFTIA